ncbi:MAG: hypothetical protein Q9225_007745, partial [Loekoesia sp. 1 TL-2023]
MASNARPALSEDGTHPENLWLKALNRLDENARQNLNYRHSDKRNILAIALRTAQEKRQLCMHKRWKFKRANGDEIIIRDVVEKIVGWLDTFKTVADVAVQFDPVHASLAWAGVAVSDKQVFGATVESLETVSRLITRYAIFEELYMQRDSAARSELQETLTDINSRVVKSALGPSEENQMQHIAAQEAKVSALARLFDAEVAKDTSQSVAAVRSLLENLEAPINRLADQAIMSIKALEEHKYLELLRWLSSIPFSRHHENHSETRIATSGRWLFSHPEYLGWNRSSSSSLLVLHGVLGSGKTTLASAVIDSILEENTGKASPAHVAYFYCAKNTFEPERSDPDEILRSLVRQLTFNNDRQRKVHETLAIEYERREAEARLDGFDVPKLRSAECIRLILDMAASNPAVIIIDAVDEVQDNRQHELLDGLHRIIQDAANVVKISGPGKSARNIAMQAFSWLLCTQEALSPAAFLNAISVMQSDQQDLELSDLLNICFNLIVLDSKLNVVRFAHTSIQEFLEAKVDFAPSRIHALAATSCLRACMQGSLSTYEVILGPTERFYHYAILYWAEHCRLATATDKNDELIQEMEEFIFDDDEISLAFGGWMDEVEQFKESLANDHPLRKAVGAVLSPSGTPLFTACAFGLSGLIQRIGNTKHFDWNQINNVGQTGVYVASAFGYESVVRLLIGRGADVNARSGHYTYPLHAASFAGHLSVVKILLGCGAHIGARGVFDNALQASFLGDHEDVALMLLENGFDVCDKGTYDSVLRQATEAGFEKVVGFLSKMHAPSYGDPAAAQGKGIDVAIVRGRIGVLERYIRHCGDSKSSLPMDAVSMAAFGGQTRIIALLLKQGQDLELEGRFGSPLRAASLMGYESTVRYLLDSGANVDACGPFGTALQAAAMKGHFSITQMLIQEGADVNLPGGFYGNALQAAAYHGHLAVVEALLDAGANIYTKGVSRDAVHAAADAGHDRIVRLFFERGYSFRGPALVPRGAAGSLRNLLRDASPRRAK